MTAADNPLRRIEDLTARLATIGTERELAVSQALAGGATWAKIAQALGCSPQAAHKRYRSIRHSDTTGAVWHERQLPLHTWGRS